MISNWIICKGKVEMDPRGQKRCALKGNKALTKKISSLLKGL